MVGMQRIGRKAPPPLPGKLRLRAAGQSHGDAALLSFFFASCHPSPGTRILLHPV